MITEEKLHKVYDKVTEENIFKTKELSEMGFTGNDLTKLVNDKVLSRVKRGEYILVDIESLFYYGKKTIQAKDYVKANAIFTACHKINPNHKGTLFQLFLESVNKENLDESFKFLDLLIKNSPEAYQRDYNVYLYLFNQFYTLPPNYQSYVQSLKEIDLMVLSTDKRFQDKDYQNQIRKAIYKKQNASANNLLFNYTSDNLKDSNIVIRRLLSIAYKRQTELNKILIELIKNEDFEKIVELLSIERNPNSLTSNFYYILVIAKDILEIKRTGIIPKVNEIRTNNYLRAIDLHNYALALSLSAAFNASKGRKDENVALTLILKAIMREIKITKDNLGYDKSVIRRVEEDILNKDIPSALENLKAFLESINKSEYEHLTVLLTKLCLVRKGRNFKLVIDFLLGLRNEEIILNTSDIIKEYEVSKKNNNIEKANLLFEIIEELEKLGIITEVVSKLTNEYSNKSIPKQPLKENEKEIEPIPPEEKVEITPILKELTIEEKDFMEAIYKRLEEDSLIILDENDSSKINIEIFNKEYNFKAHAFMIDNNYIVVKVTRYVNPYDAREYTRIGDEAFKNGNWEEAIKAYQELLPLRNTFTRVYANLGIAYMNLNNIPEAIKYLTIATGLSKLNPALKCDYSKLINELKVRISTNTKNEQKYGIDNIDLNDYYGISNINEIANLINDGKTLEEVFQTLNISSSERNMICLLLARDCYARKDYELGDSYIKQVEENPYKSKQVVAFLESLKQNKLLYQDKVNESYQALLSAVEETPMTKTTKVSLKELFRKAQNTESIGSPNPDKKVEREDKESIDIIDRRYQELKEQGEIIVLKGRDNSSLDIVEFNRRHSDAQAFYIGLGSEKRIVIKLLTKDRMNRKGIKDRAYTAYKAGDYKRSIEENKKLLALRGNNPITYVNIGLAYLKINAIPEAIKFLEIATGLAEILDNPNINYKSLISNLKGQPTTEIEDTKASVKMSESEFGNNLANNYGAKRLNEILLLMNYQGMSATEACEALCLDISESSKIFIILARECYALKEFEVGDRYLSEAEKRLPTPTIKKAISEIRNNKRFYSNRIDENYKPLVRERTLRI